MYKVVIRNSITFEMFGSHSDVLVGRYGKLSEAFDGIKDYLEIVQSWVPYLRWWFGDDGVYVDYGDWRDMLIIVPSDGDIKRLKKDYNNYMEELSVKSLKNKSAINKEKARKGNKAKTKYMKELIDRYEQLEAVKDDEMYKVLNEYINKIEKELRELL